MIIHILLPWLALLFLSPPSFPMRVHAFLIMVSFIQPPYLCVLLTSYSIDGHCLIAIVVVVETVVAGKNHPIFWSH